MTESIESQLRQILHTNFLSKKVVISSDDCLYHSYKLAGDDAWELLEGIYLQYGTVFEGFNFTDFFPSEGEVGSYAFLRFFGYKDKFKRLTFGHLVKVVEAGYWFEPLPQMLDQNHAADGDEA